MTLADKIVSRTARVGVIGLSYVHFRRGRPSAQRIKRHAVPFNSSLSSPMRASTNLLSSRVRYVTI